MSRAGRGLGPPYGAASRRSVSATQSSSVAQSVGVNTLAKAACTSSTSPAVIPPAIRWPEAPHLACDCGGVADQNGAAEIGGDNGRGGHGNKLLDVGLPERDGLRGGVVH